jgi:hypothetical protein
MKDTIFVQFYSQWKAIPSKTIWGISNGFSDTYDLCKSKGDFYWVKHNFDRQKDYIKNTMNVCEKEELPIKKGNVFVSATTTTHAYQSYVWAKKYPDIDFVVGGPSIITKTFRYDSLPKNLTFIEKSVEQYFNVPDFSYKWKLDLPKQILKDSLRFLFTYSIDTRCYWNKCIFCKYDKSSKNRIRNSFDFEFKDNVNTNKSKVVFLYTPSMTPKMMKTIIPKLPHRDDLRYILFMRSTKKENEALEEVLEKCKKGEGPQFDKILFEFGLEFPGNRMQNYMKKGSSIENAINTIKIINKYKAKLYISLILGWPNLINQDVNEVEQFIKKIPKLNKDTYMIMKIWRLFARVGTPLYDMVEKERDVNVGPFYSGFTIKLSKEQIILNNRVRDVLLNLDNVVDNYTPTLVDNYMKI